jgi:hypothetical protein
LLPKFPPGNAARLDSSSHRPPADPRKLHESRRPNGIEKIDGFAVLRRSIKG